MFARRSSPAGQQLEIVLSTVLLRTRLLCRQAALNNTKTFINNAEHWCIKDIKFSARLLESPLGKLNNFTFNSDYLAMRELCYIWIMAMAPLNGIREKHGHKFKDFRLSGNKNPLFHNKQWFLVGCYITNCR